VLKTAAKVTVDLYGHFVPGADPHHVERLAEAIEDGGRELRPCCVDPPVGVPHQDGHEPTSEFIEESPWLAW
jgi:hypothetical protein